MWNDAGRTLVQSLLYWSSEYDYPAGLMEAAALRIQELEEQMDKPSVGRIIHYVAYGTPGGEFPAGVCRAAVITEVYDVRLLPDERGVIPDYPTGGIFTFGPEGFCTDVGLCVLNPAGLFFNRGIPYDERKTPGSWHWPERV